MTNAPASTAAAPLVRVRPRAAPTLRWSALDTVMLVGLTALAGAVRLEGITHPHALVFDEFYAADACLYAFGPDACPVAAESSVVHPPLARWLMAAGIRLFGFTPAGWRVAPLAAGTLAVAVLYLLARRLLGSTLAASLAAGLLAFDLLHFVMSRTAMLDVFVVFFGLVSFLCVVYHADSRPALDDGGVGWRRRVFEARWLIGAGIAGGAAVASKWSGAYLLLAVAALAVLHAGVRARSVAGDVRRAARASAAAIAVALVVVPAAVYVLSFAGRLEGTVLAWPWRQESWIRGLFERHQIMLEHHTGPLYTHPYTSPPWSWPLVERPVLFFFREPDAARYEEILAIGNPLVWWPALLAVGIVGWRFLRQPRARGPDVVILSGFLAAYLPWFVITRQEAFLYYFLPAVPFLYLALAQVAAGIPSRAGRALAGGALAAASLAMFLFFRPVLTAEPLDYTQWERRIWFNNCGPAEAGARRIPITRPIPSPGGWCWL